MSATHRTSATIGKGGHLVITNLPFEEGTRIEVVISKSVKRSGAQRLIQNDHAWSEDDIKAVEKGRNIINQWKIS
jgi:hypothetical protein